MAAVAVLLGAGYPAAVARGAGDPPVDPEDMVRGHVQLEETVISGESGTPKVINIVPWKDEKPAAGDSDLKRSFRDEILSPVVRDDFTRRYGEGFPR